MNVVTRRKATQPRLVALFAVVTMLLMTLPAHALAPVDSIEFTGETCSSGIAMAQVTATGKGRWGLTIVEVSTNGGSSFESVVNPHRGEHGTSFAVAWPGSAIFRAIDAKNNGATIGEYVYSDPIVCP